MVLIGQFLLLDHRDVHIYWINVLKKFTLDAHFAWTCALKMTLQLSMGTVFSSVEPRRPSFQSDAIVAGCLCWLAGCIIKIFRGGGMVTP